MEYYKYYLIIFVCIVKFLKGEKCMNEEKCNCMVLLNFKELYYMDCFNKGLNEILILFVNFEVYSIDLL